MMASLRSKCFSFSFLNVDCNIFLLAFIFSLSSYRNCLCCYEPTKILAKMSQQELKIITKHHQSKMFFKREPRGFYLWLVCGPSIPGRGGASLGWCPPPASIPRSPQALVTPSVRQSTQPSPPRWSHSSKFHWFFFFKCLTINWIFVTVKCYS